MPWGRRQLHDSVATAGKMLHGWMERCGAQISPWDYAKGLSATGAAFASHKLLVLAPWRNYAWVLKLSMQASLVSGRLYITANL